MSTITTHILDTALGKPASNVAISLDQLTNEGWQQIAEGRTDSDGRLKTLTPEPIVPGHYRLTAEIGDYFAQSNRPSLTSRHKLILSLHRPANTPSSLSYHPEFLVNLPGELR